jgi:flagellar hook assembly protein FlgD
MLAQDQELLATDVTIRLRVNKEYKNFVGSNENAGKPMYGWSMDQIATQIGSQDMLKEALDLINVVPNPYYAFSEYERNKLDNRIKITNLPEQCQIRIYTSNGKLIRNIKKDSPLTFQDWDLTNHAGIPVASGIYLIHVEVPNVGERVLKAFIAMRMVDLQNI